MQLCNHTGHNGSHKRDVRGSYPSIEDRCAPVWVIVRALTSITGTHYALYNRMNFHQRRHRRHGCRAAIMRFPGLPPWRMQAPRRNPFMPGAQRNAGSADGSTATGKARVAEQQCTGCGICQTFCPVGAITMTDRIVVDQHRCTGCGLCVEACPVGALTLG